MKTKRAPSDLSYFRLSLIELLRESFPELLADEKFINARVDNALNAYGQAAENGGNPLEAEHSANEVLFGGLHFSKHDTLKNILWYEFSGEVSEDEAKDFAIRLLPECEEIFAKYAITDDFAYSPEYDLLYTELVGGIAIKLI